jgi:hypothetical protein
MNLDLDAMEKRWKEFPVTIVPQHVSDPHGLEESQSLYAYLDNIRIAYMAGALLAAISMCRSASEILIRMHYNSNDFRTDLTPLIRRTGAKKEFSFLKAHNLETKIDEASKVLHANKNEIRNPDRLSTIVRSWVPVIQDMIVRAPLQT